MNEPTIVLPRRWVEALTQTDTGYVQYLYFTERLECVLCKQQVPFGDSLVHASDCPVRLVQERLQQIPCDACNGTGGHHYVKDDGYGIVEYDSECEACGGTGIQETPHKDT